MAEDYRRWEKRIRRLRPGGLYRYRFIFVAFAALACLGFAWLLRPAGIQTPLGFTRFSSEQEFRDYMAGASWMEPYLPQISRAPSILRSYSEGMAAYGGAPTPMPPERISVTNVQVSGIDEPDIVKTDGMNIYFSPPLAFYLWWIQVSEGGSESEFGYIPEWKFPSYRTIVVRAFPPQDLSVRSQIEKTGDMLLVENILVVFSYDEITGYDVSDPDLPKEMWNIKLGGSLAAARLHDGRIYLVVQSYVSTKTEFPIVPLEENGENLSVWATEIYRPIKPAPFDTVYTAVVLDPFQGRAIKSLSFVGQFSTSIVYMSPSALYVTYTYYSSQPEAFYDFVRGDNSAETMRELQRTGIVKIRLDDFTIAAQGEVPGYPLNQFSLDEFGGYLRVATTVEPLLFESVSANDIYVLDGNLRVVGSIENLGLSERIYAVRFIADKGYVVTFRETDPFYVLDLSDPMNPKLSGELKIPGYSSYLHPITENLILGIGMENWQVKISLFDVSDPSQPEEIARQILDEPWSDVLETHHAFLLDPDRKVFFLPAGRTGYVFSYENGSIAQVLKTEATGVRRAVYLDNFLYLIGDGGVKVFDESTWESVNEVEFS